MHIKTVPGASEGLFARACVIAGGEARQTALAEFYNKWQKEPLVILKWITIQVGTHAA